MAYQEIGVKRTARELHIASGTLLLLACYAAEVRLEIINDECQRRCARAPWYLVSRAGETHSLPSCHCQDFERKPGDGRRDNLAMKVET